MIHALVVVGENIKNVVDEAKSINLLGQNNRGCTGFAEYVDMAHKALREYRCIIEELMSEGNKVFVKMTFTGIHQNELMCYVPPNIELYRMAALYSRLMENG